LELNGFYLLREGERHSIYTNGIKTIPVKRHRVLDRITANELCKQAGLKPNFDDLSIAIDSAINHTHFWIQGDMTACIPGTISAVNSRRKRD